MAKVGALREPLMQTPPSLGNHMWLPFTPNRDFRQSPRVLVGADGMHFTTQEGQRVLDGISSLWCVGAGHNRAPINEANHRLPIERKAEA